jgi:hypothetical protein
MNRLALVLDELVADAPVDKASWTDVLARNRSRRSRLASVFSPGKKLAVALAALVVLAFAGTAIGIGIDLLTQQERFHANMPDDPDRVGPLVEITSGERWALIAWNSNVGVCLDFAIPGNSPFSCGFPVRGAKRATDASGAGLPTHAVAGSVSGGGLVGGDEKTTIFGVAALDVATVAVELSNGQAIGAPLYDAPPELAAKVQFFIVRLRLPSTGLSGQGPVRAFLAYDHDGRLIERYEL